MKRFIVFFIFSLTATVVLAQDEPVVAADTVVEEYEDYVFDTTDYATDYGTEYRDSDSDTIVNPRDTQAAAAYMNEEQTLKKFDDNAWKTIVGDKNYDEKLEPTKKKEAREPWFRFPAIDPQILRLISFAVIIVIFAVILYFVVRNTTFSQNIRKMQMTDIAAPVENIDEIDIDALLKQALANGDLRAAVRVHYLMLLKKLNEAGLIAWKKNKTNRDYLSELYGRNDCYEDVRKLTLAYELVWYGERSVSQDSFNRLTGDFESVHRHVARDKPEA